MKNRLFENRLFLKLAVFTLPLPTIANQLGGFTAEVGRQPWIVYRVEGMRTRDAISPTVSSLEIAISLVLFSLIYALLFALWIHLLKRAVRKGPIFESQEEEVAA